MAARRPPAASELGQLRAGHGDPYQAPSEIDDQGGVVFDTDDPAEPVLIVCTWSCSANSSAGGAGGSAPKGLVGRRRRLAARAGFIITSMRPSARHRSGSAPA